MKNTNWMFCSNLKPLLFACVALGLLAASSREFGLPVAKPCEASKTLTRTQRYVLPIAFNGGGQKDVLAESNDLVVRLDRIEPCSECLGKISFVFKIRNKLQKTTTEFAIGNETTEVHRVFFAGWSRLIVLGSVGSAADIVNLVDLNSRSLIDRFYCYRPSVSKNGRFIAYVKFFPRFSTAQWSYVYLVYDLTGSRAEHRLRPSEGFSDQENVGIPVYPIENFKRGVYETMIDDEALVHFLASSEIFWIEENVFAFVDRWKKVNSLVIVDVSAGVHKAKVTVKPIDTMEVVDRSRCNEHLEDPESLIYVEEMSIPENKRGYIRLHLAPQGQCLRTSTLDVAIQ